MKKIGIIGYGYVGQAFVKMVSGKFETWVINRSEVERDRLPEGVYFAGISEDEEARKAINQCDLAVVCVPTGSVKEDGSCDTSIVEEVISWLEAPVILIKSTVAPGTTDRLSSEFKKRIVFSPEYVGEGKYHVTPRMDFQTDMVKTPFMICGGNDVDCNYIFDLLLPILGPEKTYYKCSALEAELIKYMENTYFGVKITFAQEMYDIVKAFGADWYKVWQGWALDPRVDVMHTAVFPESRGFSGKCLPKDLNALVMASHKKGYTPKFLMAMLKKNAEIRPTEPVRAKLNAKK